MRTGDVTGRLDYRDKASALSAHETLALCLRWRKGNDLTTDMAAMVAGNGRRGQNLDVVKIHAKIVSGVGLRMVCMILS